MDWATVAAGKHLTLKVAFEWEVEAAAGAVEAILTEPIEGQGWVRWKGYCGVEGLVKLLSESLPNGAPR